MAVEQVAGVLFTHRVVGLGDEVVRMLAVTQARLVAGEFHAGVVRRSFVDVANQVIRSIRPVRPAHAVLSPDGVGPEVLDREGRGLDTASGAFVELDATLSGVVTVEHHRLLVTPSSDRLPVRHLQLGAAAPRADRKRLDVALLVAPEQVARSRDREAGTGVADRVITAIHPSRLVHAPVAVGVVTIVVGAESVLEVPDRDVVVAERAGTLCAAGRVVAVPDCHRLCRARRGVEGNDRDERGQRQLAEQGGLHGYPPQVRPPGADRWLFDPRWVLRKRVPPRDSREHCLDSQASCKEQAWASDLYSG